VNTKIMIGFGAIQMHMLFGFSNFEHQKMGVRWRI